MGFSIYSIFKAGLLLLNAITILHPRRLLAQYGLDQINPENGQSLKNQFIGLIQAASYLKVPLIFANSLIIVIEIIAGG